MQLNQASSNRKVLKYGSENQLNVYNYLPILFLWFSIDRTIWKGHVSISLIGCAPYNEEDRSLVLKNVRITGIWQKNKFQKIKSMQHVLAALQ